MITKTQYDYTCLTSEGFTKTFKLVVQDTEIFLWENSLGKRFKSIEEAETYLCSNFRDILLVSKTEIKITKLEKPIFFEVSIAEDTKGWCKCQKVYSSPDGIFCPKCKNPIL